MEQHYREPSRFLDKAYGVAWYILLPNAKKRVPKLYKIYFSNLNEYQITINNLIIDIHVRVYRQITYCPQFFSLQVLTIQCTV